MGGKRPGKRVRGAAGKKPIFVAVERRHKHAGFMAAEAVQEISKSSIRDFLSRYVRTGQEVRTDALAALNATAEKHVHQKRVNTTNSSFRMVAAGAYRDW